MPACPDRRIARCPLPTHEKEKTKHHKICTKYVPNPSCEFSISLAFLW